MTDIIRQVRDAYHVSLMERPKTVTLVYSLRDKKQKEVEFSGDENHCWKEVGKFVTFNQPIQVIATRWSYS